jgi:hypothetical protein
MMHGHKNIKILMFVVNHALKFKYSSRQDKG